MFRRLLDCPTHATAEDLFREVNRFDPRSSRATVYNTLRALIRAGLVREVAVEGRSARFDANLESHHHFLCECCGTVEDVEWFELPGAARGTAFEGRIVRGYEVMFRGMCAGCAGNREEEADV